ncbi:ly6/PLAUR domain-containing protein 8-like [Chionomys nivalis]|uniref:ly6/PLAUR domain-containing protein 8-like n=1 Tax=Chionomys nivalis TaxID=269649 RepID=UPI0025918485|nr:ly6/PLAUR domain-containing protein 8-like [Chionomys nivalis]
MKGILIAGVFAAFAITVIDSLKCTQCSSISEGTGSCPSEPQNCPDSDPVTEWISCVESSVNSTLGGSPYSYENKFCSKDKCSTVNNNTEVSFTVRVSDNQQFSFASQCCEGDACPNNNNNNEGPEEEGGDGNTRANTQIQCPSCYSSSTTTDCKEEIRQCSQGERCVHIIADHVDGTVHNKVELKGCSNIDEATCDILTPGNVTVGEFAFQMVSCTNEITTTTPTTVTTTPSTSTSIKASFISSVFGSLLLLKLLF